MRRASKRLSERIGEISNELRRLWKPQARLRPQGDAQNQVLRLWRRVRGPLQADRGKASILPDMLPEAQAPTKKFVLIVLVHFHELIVRIE